LGKKRGGDDEAVALIHRAAENAEMDPGAFFWKLLGTGSLAIETMPRLVNWGSARFGKPPRAEVGGEITTDAAKRLSHAHVFRNGIHGWVKVLAVVLSLSGATGCGECVFRQPVSGVVRNKAGAPIAGAKLSTCNGDRCLADPAADRQPCNASTSDDRGEFTLEVANCRPKAFACELRPVQIEHTGCTKAVLQPPRGPNEPFVVTLDCK
jgi:hypothetical protein